MANNTSSPTPIVVDESIYSSISSTPQCNEPTPPPTISTTSPSSPPTLSIPPRFRDPFLDNLFDLDLLISPTSSFTQLERLGSRLAPEPRAVLAQKVAQAALKRAHETEIQSDQRQTALDTITVKEALTLKMWREEVASLQQ